MKKLLGIVVLGLLLIPTLAMSGTFKDEEGKFGLKTKKSGFKFHLNFMDHDSGFVVISIIGASLNVF